MDLLMFLLVLVFGSSVRGYSVHDYLGLAEEQQYILDYPEDNNTTSEVEESNRKHAERPVNTTTVGVSNTSIPFFGVEAEEKDKTEAKNSGYSRHSFTVSDSVEMTSEKHFLDPISKIQEESYANYDENLQNEEAEPNSPPIRREINNWKGSNEFLESESLPWNYDAFYPRDSKYTQGEYFDYPNPLLDSYEPKNSTSVVVLKAKEDNSHPEPPQYYQKNYYYNYYPPMNSRKYLKASKWEDEEERSSEGKTRTRASSPGRRLLKKSSCKQYLQFLKYAFEKLDENPEYYYDYNEDLNEEKNLRDKVEPKVPRVFGNHMMGPTLYVDNSGKIAQMNSKGNSVQSVEGLIPSSRMVLSTEGDPITVKYRPMIQTISVEPPATSPTLYQTTTELPLAETPEKTDEPASTKLPNDHETDDGSKSSASNRSATEGKNYTEHDYRTTQAPPSTPMPTTPKIEYETTVQIDIEEEKDNYDDYEYDLKTTIDPQWFLPEDFYQKLENSLETTEKSLMTNNFSSNTTVIIGSPHGRFTPRPPPTTTTVSLTNPPEPRVESTTGSPPENSREASNREDVDCNDKTLPCPDTFNLTYPLNGYCNRYVSCESGRAIRRTCPDGLHFNIITKSCDLPHNSFCAYACPQQQGYYGIPGDCGGYFICKDSVAEYRMCPPRMHWDKEKTICTFIELSSCPMKCGKDSEVKPYDGDCRAYVICLGGIPYYHKCPPNTKFDKKVLTCVPDKASDCEDDPRLLTKTLNPNHLCRNFEAKLGSQTWCNFFK